MTIFFRHIRKLHRSHSTYVLKRNTNQMPHIIDFDKVTLKQVSHIHNATPLSIQMCLNLQPMNDNFSANRMYNKVTVTCY